LAARRGNALAPGVEREVILSAALLEAGGDEPAAGHGVPRGATTTLTA
jgi:hypothetical protein